MGIKAVYKKVAKDTFRKIEEEEEEMSPYDDKDDWYGDDYNDYSWDDCDELDNLVEDEEPEKVYNPDDYIGLDNYGEF